MKTPRKSFCLLTVGLSALLFPALPAFGQGSSAAAPAKVDLNTASLEELEALPGIGAKTAQRIVALRPIASLAQLAKVPGLTAAKLEALEGRVSVDPDSSKTFEIKVAGSPVTVTCFGTGPVGVIVFGHSDSKAMVKYLHGHLAELGGLIPEKCSLFLWSYPDAAPFDQVPAAIQGYLKDRSTSLPLPGIAASVVEQIKEHAELKQYLIIGNSLGAGLVLQDYGTLSRDQTLSFLLLSPTEAFMPTPTQIPRLERTTLLAARGWGEGTGVVRTDPFLRGAEAWDWMAKNRATDWGDLITRSTAADPTKLRITDDGTDGVESGPRNFDSGHKTIGGEIDARLLGKLIRVQLGWVDKAVLSEADR